ncbi:dnaK protein [Tritrichomonas foetus]|uniref:DnaK protein n=1 Tax=Tritrichomonas foetus TaxID=1144522 RepID=A0A1J4KLY1_9EUKA|nr:dnaK protein [Tritrichomonas foetus]|eukprot:OHT10381.1 dnaK protein [Tritrichomonas foetus]
MAKVAGIDFGDQYCVIGIYRNNGVDIITNQCSNRLTPTMVTYTDSRRFAGETSQQQQMQYVNCTFTHLKRLLALPYDSRRCDELKESLPFELVPQNLYTAIQVTHGEEKKVISPEQCVGYLIKELAKIVKNHEPNVEKYVISVPQCWTEIQRRSLLNSTKLAGINCISLLNSNTAAALCYYKNHEKKFSASKPTYTVFIDVGNSAMNVALVNFKTNKIEMVSYASDTNLGGSHYNKPFADYLLDQVKSKYKIDPSQSQRAFLRFLDAVEKTKRNLSVNKVVQFEVHSIMGIDISFPVQREKFEEVIKPLVRNIPKLLDKCITPSKVRKNEILDIEILGGGSRVVAVKEIITNYFKKPPSASLNLEECFAIGCTIFANFLDQKMSREFFIQDILPYDITVEWLENGSEKSKELFRAISPLISKKKFDVRVTNTLIINVTSRGIVIGNLEVNTNSKVSKIVSITGSIDKNGIISFTASEAASSIKYIDENHISSDTMKKYKEIEAKMELQDKEQEQIDNIRNSLESELFICKNFIERDFPENFSNTDLQKGNEILLKIQLWFEENEFDRLPVNEYQLRINQLKAVFEPVQKRHRLYVEIDDKIGELKKLANTVFMKYKNDPQHRMAIQEILDSVRALDTSPRCVDPPYDIYEIEARLFSLQ